MTNVDLYGHTTACCWRETKNLKTDREEQIITDKQPDSKEMIFAKKEIPRKYKTMSSI